MLASMVLAEESGQDDKYTLRQKLYDPPRQTELFIVVTMYNVRLFLWANWELPLTARLTGRRRPVLPNDEGCHAEYRPSLHQVEK
jgi:hypothetical protein